MNEKDFGTLVASVKQAGRIRRGRMKPGRVMRFRTDDIKAIRNKLKKSQAEFALMIGVSISTLLSPSCGVYVLTQMWFTSGRALQKETYSSR